jgi:hypothetical protein
MRATGADIKSWTENNNPKVKRPCRMFVVEVRARGLLPASRLPAPLPSRGRSRGRNT